MNLDHDFVKGRNLVKTERKMQIEHFFSPNSGDDQKKKKRRSTARIKHFFSPILGQDQKNKKKGLQQE